MLKLVHGLHLCGKSHLVERELKESQSTFSVVYDSDWFDSSIPGLNTLLDSNLKDMFVKKQVYQEFENFALRKSREKNKLIMLSSLISLNGTVLAVTNSYFRNLKYDISFILEPEELLSRWQKREKLFEMNYEVATRWVSDSIVWAKRNNVLQIILQKDQYLADCLTFIHKNGKSFFCLTDPKFVFIPEDFKHIYIVSNKGPILTDRGTISSSLMYAGSIEKASE